MKRPWGSCLSFKCKLNDGIMTGACAALYYDIFVVKQMNVYFTIQSSTVKIHFNVWTVVDLLIHRHEYR